jgi:hypothetical protein
VIKGSKPGQAKISLDGEQIAEIRRGENLTFKLISMDGHEWTLTNKVHGEFRPFSISIFDQSKEGKYAGGEVLLFENIFSNTKVDSICLQIILKEDTGTITLVVQDTYLG